MLAHRDTRRASHDTMAATPSCATRPAPLVAGLALALSMTANAQVTPTHEGVTYAVIGGRPALLDLYIPSGAGPFPLVVWIHGGGWSGGGRFPAGFATPLMARGFAVASIEYRLTSQAAQWGGEPVTFPAQINDCKGAIRWLRANAPIYNLDHTRIGAWGTSAGGHLTALVATAGVALAIEGSIGGNTEFSSCVQAGADYFGPIDLLQMNPDVTTPPGSTIDHDAPGSPESRLLGFDDPGQGIGALRANISNPAPPYPFFAGLAAQVNPISWVGADDPPMFIAHGDSDTSVPWRQSLRLHNALDAAGVFNDYRIIPGAGHGNLGNPTLEATLDFFQQRLGALAPCEGDVTGDRRVAFNDLNIVLDNFGDTGLAVAGDLNRDGIVNFADLNIVLARFGAPC